MLHLPDVTLLAIDCFGAVRTWRAMRESMRWVKFGDVVLVTDPARFGRAQLLDADAYALRLVPRKHSTEKRTVSGIPPLPVDYEMDVLRLTPELLRTDFCLFMEWDSGVINPDAWQQAFYRYDYIGAPWPDHHDAGWPACDRNNNVGNGGFSFKSRKFAEFVREATEAFKGDPSMISSDRWQCRTLRPWLENRGIRFAPEELASRFSCENRIYAGAFGFHGRLTAMMNGWGGWLETVRPNKK